MPDKDFRRVYATLVTSNNYLPGALTLAHSIRASGSAYPIVALVAPTQLSKHVLDSLYRAFDRVIHVPLLRSGAAPNDATNLELLGRPELDITLTKLHVWNPDVIGHDVQEVAFMDADAYVVKNACIDNIFNQLADGAVFAAAPDVGWPDIFNSGVFVLRPSKEVFEALLWDAQYLGSFDGGDQGLLNSFFSTWSGAPPTPVDSSEGVPARPPVNIGRVNRLPFLYNVTPSAVYSYLPAFTRFHNNIVVVHFAGTVKPWKLLRFTDGSVIGEMSDQARDLYTIWWSLHIEYLEKVEREDRERDEERRRADQQKWTETLHFDQAARQSQESYGPQQNSQGGQGNSWNAPPAMNSSSGQAWQPQQEHHHHHHQQHHANHQHHHQQHRHHQQQWHNHGHQQQHQQQNQHVHQHQHGHDHQAHQHHIDHHQAHVQQTAIYDSSQQQQQLAQAQPSQAKAQPQGARSPSSGGWGLPATLTSRYGWDERELVVPKQQATALPYVQNQETGGIPLKKKSQSMEPAKSPKNSNVTPLSTAGISNSRSHLSVVELSPDGDLSFAPKTQISGSWMGEGPTSAKLQAVSQQISNTGSNKRSSWIQVPEPVQAPVPDTDHSQEYSSSRYDWDISEFTPRQRKLSETKLNALPLLGITGVPGASTILDHEEDDLHLHGVDEEGVPIKVPLKPRRNSSSDKVNQYGGSSSGGNVISEFQKELVQQGVKQGLITSPYAPVEYQRPKSPASGSAGYAKRMSGGSSSTSSGRKGPAGNNMSQQQTTITELRQRRMSGDGDEFSGTHVSGRLAGNFENYGSASGSTNTKVIKQEYQIVGSPTQHVVSSPAQQTVSSSRHETVLTQVSGAVGHKTLTGSPGVYQQKVFTVVKELPVTEYHEVVSDGGAAGQVVVEQQEVISGQAATRMTTTTQQKVFTPVRQIPVVSHKEVVYTQQQQQAAGAGTSGHEQLVISQSGQRIVTAMVPSTQQQHVETYVIEGGSTSDAANLKTLVQGQGGQATTTKKTTVTTVRQVPGGTTTTETFVTSGDGSVVVSGQQAQEMLLQLSHEHHIKTTTKVTVVKKAHVETTTSGGTKTTTTTSTTKNSSG